jgi:Zn-dependent protease
MKQSVRLGRVAGIPVGLHWSAIVILALIAEILGASVLPGVIPHRSASIYWIMAILGALLFLASLLAHELAHALVARRKGVQVRSITLWVLGGVTELDGQATTPAAELQIALAGPATSVAAGAVFCAAALATARVHGLAVVTAALVWLAAMNALLAVFNMLPGAPLDGGRVLKALVWRHHGDQARAERLAGQAGRYVGIAIAAAGVAEFVGWRNLGGLWLLVIGWFLATAAGAEAHAARAKDAMAGVRVCDIMTPDPDIAPAWSTAADFVERVVPNARQSVFPVVGFDGDLVGVVSLDQLARLHPLQRSELRLDRVAMAVPSRYRVAPDDSAASLFTRPLIAGELAAVVLADGRIVGTVTTADLRRALQLAPLHRVASSGAALNEWPARPRPVNR